MRFYSWSTEMVIKQPKSDTDILIYSIQIAKPGLINLKDVILFLTFY